MILSLTVFLPILLACALPAFRGRRTLTGAVGWAAALPAAALAWSGIVLPEESFSWLLLGTDFELNELTAVFFALSATLWMIAGWFAQSYLAEDPAPGRFQAFFLLSMAGNFGLIAAADLVSFYGFFVLMTFAAYGLVVHQGDKEALRAGRIYLIMSLVGEVLLLYAMFLAVEAAGSTRIESISAAIAVSEHRTLICTLAFLGFGVKAGAVPLYFWLPLAHPVAPTPASAVLSGSMIKAGLLGWLYFLPAGSAALPAGSHALILLGFVAAFGAAALGLCQRRPKTILAYSSISQMGLITVLLGLGLADPGLWSFTGPAIAVFALHHGLAKGALFLGTGVLPVSPQRWRWLVLGGLCFTALAIAGAPLTSGLLAKYALKEAIPEGDGRGATVIVSLLSLSAVSTSLLLGKFLWILKQAPSDAGHGTFKGLALPWGVLMLSVAMAPYVAIGHFQLPLGFPELTAGSIAAALWPVAMAVLILAGFLAYAPAPWRALQVPAGDGVVLVERLIASLKTRTSWIQNDWWDRDFLNFTAWADRIIAFEETKSLVNRIESRLGDWNLMGLLLTALLLGFIFLFTAF